MNSNSRIEKVVNDIYEYVESAKPARFSQNSIILQKDLLYNFLEELQLCYPEEIKRYQKIIANREGILEDARAKGEEIIRRAEEQAAQLVADSEIMRQANEQAYLMLQDAQYRSQQQVEQAERESEQLRTSGLAYVNDILGEAERVVGNAFEKSRKECETMLSTLQEQYEMIVGNRSELKEQLTPQPSVQPMSISDDDDFAFDKDAFLEGIDIDEQ